MANVWFSVIVLIFVQNVFAFFCPENSKVLSCDQCIRCGGTWCSQEKVDVRCSYAEKDDWCSEPETLYMMNPHADRGKSIEPAYAERTLFIDNLDRLSFSYTSDVEKKVSHLIHNTTQNLDSVEIKTTQPICIGSTCKLYIEAKVGYDFCSSTSTNMEFIYVSIKVDNVTEEALIKYHVPCACECSRKTLRKAPQCSGNGDLTCGACACYEGSSGAHCEKMECRDRGDVPNTCNDLGCSGNGYCGPCGNCICYSDREGSQYFDPRNLCSDICMETSERETNCGPCLTSPTTGACPTPLEKPECHPRITLKYNETIAMERDEFNRKIWISCNDTFEMENEQSCYVEYVAMKDEDNTLRLMVVKSCNDRETQMVVVGAAQTKVPIILGVLGILAAVAAVGGVMLWKHLNSAPPMPFASPDYQNIDAEDCVGENPLYKSPTSTFTNPQFGKC